MLSLNETVERTPAHVFYLGSEAEFLDELESLSRPVSEPEKLEFTCSSSARELIAQLYTYDATRRNCSVVVFGLLRYLERNNVATPETVLRHWSAVLNSGVPNLQFGDTSRSELIDNLLSTARRRDNNERKDLNK